MENNQSATGKPRLSLFSLMRAEHKSEALRIPNANASAWNSK